MNNKSNMIKMVLISQKQTVSKHLLGLVFTGAMLLILSCTNSSQAVVDLIVDPILQQAVFKTPEDAAQAFVHAVAADDDTELNKILGADFRQVLPIGSVTDEDADHFIAAWDKYHILIPQGHKKMLLAVGEGEWTLPIPIVSASTGWYFNVEEGLERMHIRRIGRNELATIQTVLAYYDAQMEYAEEDHSSDHIFEYAQKFISTPGTHDGLYWEVGPDEPLSPLGTLLANRTPGGGYHGYFYRILKAQGKHAMGGAYSYLIGNQMRAGFALVAWPDNYGESGIMSFMVSHAGIVYEQNLGPDGAKIAEKMLTYNPGPGWVATQEVTALENNKEE